MHTLQSEAFWVFPGSQKKTLGYQVFSWAALGWVVLNFLVAFIIFLLVPTPF